MSGDLRPFHFYATENRVSFSFMEKLYAYAEPARLPLPAADPGPVWKVRGARDAGNALVRLTDAIAVFPLDAE